MWIFDYILWTTILIILIPAIFVGLAVPWGQESQRWGDE